MKQLLSDAIDDYMVLRSSQDYSAGTLNNERGVLRRFLTVTGNIWTHNINERHALRYFEEAGKTRSNATLSLDHTILGQFFEWMRKTRRLPLDMDPLIGRRRPRGVKKVRDRVPVTMFPHLLDVAYDRDPRDRAMVAVFMYTLIRDQELADLRVGDVDLESGYLRVRITKSNTEDNMPISAELDTELRMWLTYYAEVADNLTPHNYLLPRRQTTRLIRGGGGTIAEHKMVYVPHKPCARPGRVVKDVLEEAGFPVRDHTGKPKGEGSHTLRRSAARALFDRLAESGYDRSLRIVQSMLHHSSVTMTEHYIGITPDQRSRDEIIKGQTMYPVSNENLVQLPV